jgi:excisionase family DNA binding protein
MIALSMDEPHRFLTIEETAKALRISKQSFYTLMRKKKIRVTRIGGRTFIDRQDLDDFIEKSKSDLE